MRTAELVKYVQSVWQPKFEQGEVIIKENGEVIENITFFKWFSEPDGDTLVDVAETCKKMGVKKFYIDFNRFYTEFIEELGMKPVHKHLKEYISN